MSLIISSFRHEIVPRTSSVNMVIFQFTVKVSELLFILRGGYSKWHLIMNKNNYLIISEGKPR